MYRDVLRNLNIIGLTDSYQSLLEVMGRVLVQKRSDNNKVYSLREPKVSCIAKGKQHKPYEFGNIVLFKLHKLELINITDFIAVVSRKGGVRFGRLESINSSSVVMQDERVSLRDVSEVWTAIESKILM